MERKSGKHIALAVVCLLMLISNSITAFAIAPEDMEVAGDVISVENVDSLVAGIPTVVLAMLIVAVAALAIVGIIFGVRFLKKKSDDHYYFDEEDEDPEEMIQ